MTDRLTPTPRHGRRSGLAVVLDHLADSHPAEHATALGMLAEVYTWGHTAIADALTGIARDDNLGVKVTEKSIRDYRKEHRPA